MRLAIAVCLLVCAACGGGGTSSHAQPDAAVDAYFSNCGHPGDLGNELGIGKFCASLSECSTTASAPLCSSLGDKDTHFCTRTCTMGSTDQCGTATTCTCNASNQCGCTPTVCL